MVMGVAIKIAGMTLGAGAASAAVNGGITMAVRANNPGAVSTCVTVGAGVFMDNANRITTVAIGAEEGVGQRRRMAVGVSAKVTGVATDAGAALDSADIIAGRKGSQGWS